MLIKFTSDGPVISAWYWWNITAETDRNEACIVFVQVDDKGSKFYNPNTKAWKPCKRGVWAGPIPYPEV